MDHLEDITSLAMSAPCYEAEEEEVHMAAISRSGQLLMWVSDPTARARLDKGLAVAGRARVIMDS